jgi:hypothetical protein
MCEDNKLSFFGKKFWDLVLMKLVRNLASVKYQWMILLYVPVLWGMYNLGPDGKPWISSTEGLGGLFGGFVTLALGRIIANTSLVDKGNEELDTDK